jgi:uncharacterized OsmC-like protein
MATIINGNYLGELRCNMIHEESESQIMTDAPKDNKGKGERFSPTDLLAAALGSCMVTILAIRANSKNIDLGLPEFKSVKNMQANPRRIKQIDLTINLNKNISKEDRSYLENEAINCPVALSLSSKVIQNITFNYI